MAKAWILAVVFAVTLVAGGCSSPEKQVVGKWKGQMQMADTGSQGDEFAKAMANMFAGNITLEIKTDKTFSLNMFITAEGTWAMNGKTVVLTPKSVMGQDATKSTDSKPMELELSGDGKTLTLKPDKDAKDKSTLTFKKEEESK